MANEKCTECGIFRNEAMSQGKACTGGGTHSFDKKGNALDVQVGGNHYKQFKIQPVDFITANNLGYIEGCIIKYICRHRFKNGIEDLKKIKHYCDLLIDLVYKRGKRET